MKPYLALFLFFTAGFCFITAQTSNPDDFKNHVDYLTSEALEGRGLGTDGKNLATAYIKEQFALAGLKPFVENYLQAFPLQFYLARVNATNVIGLVEGTDPILKDEYIVLGAHYDHLGYNLSENDEKNIYPGADDNASGVAMLIELAKYFAKPENNPKRSLIFIAFDAEESGLRGSNHFVKQLGNEKLKSIKAMFGFDMVGMLQANNGLELKGIQTLENGKQLAEKHSGNLQLFKINNEIEQRTDTQPFGAKGIPAVHVFTGTKSPYHQHSDKADLLDYQGMVTINQFMTNILTELANQPHEIKAIRHLNKLRRRENVLSHRFRMGFVLDLGVGNHLYKEKHYNAKTSFAYASGLHLNYKLSRAAHLSLEALYDYTTSKSANGTFKRHSLTLPLNIELGTPSLSGKSDRFFLFAGPYFRHNFSAKDASVSLNTADFKANEWGYSLGCGLEALNVALTLTYRRSFSSILPSETIFQSGTYLSITYKFL
ncbi:M20/M25/M40 family metallo-hydrolase [Capnocytophaga sp.]|uniref:M20/M25/M40 family metallo-hydrolase n=1 Tax=Capnocytophaga sp. TaxID=44737 RepID=UPI0026DB770F|nr:M20/M25/M40 family metallo-hydrolase [Capnocytophaga sp.]MDO5105008.1 M20/M25/M40 family metallo-hydrolase [Capnocytophaga sp.]